MLDMDMGEVSDWLINNSDRFTLQPKPIEVYSLEDIEITGTNILCFDGKDWVIDQVKRCPEKNINYMVNGTQVEAYMPLPSPY